MDDALLVGVLDGLADLHEELQALFDVQPLSIAILGDGDPRHVLHDEVGSSRLRRPGVEHLGNVGVVHHRQCLPLGLEAGDHLPGVHAQLDDLQRHPPADGLLLLGQIDDGEAALADLLQDLVVADALAGLKLSPVRPRRACS